MPVQEDIDEQQLIDRSRAGDLGAFNRLVERHQHALYNLCLRMLASPPSAEDATQDAFISAFRSLHTFRGGSFRAWLFRIASNACYDEMRRRKARPSTSLDVPTGEGERPFEIASGDASPDQLVEQTELGALIQVALARLPPDQRLAVVLCDVQGLDYLEIAQAMNVSLGTVKSRISRARLRLRAILLEQRELLPSRFRQSSEDP